jgi:AraC-like DNA-binding protein
MEISFPQIALIVTASQSFLLAMLIAFRHRALFANRFLTALLLCFTLIAVHLLIQDAGVYHRFPFIFILVGVPLCASPLQFLYTKYLLRHESRMAEPDRLHFLPFAALELVLIAGFFAGWFDLSAAASAGPETAPPALRLFNIVLIVQGIGYSAAGLRLIGRFDRQVKNALSSIEQVRMNWLRNTTLAMLSAWGLFLLEDLLMMQGINLTNFILVSVVFAVYLYAIGVIGLLKSEIFSLPDVEEAMQNVAVLAEEESAGPSIKYEKSGLSPETAQEYVNRLVSLMEEQRPYTRSSLTLSQLAGMLGISPHNLSETINSQLKMNFYDFVNGYRVEQVKRDLVDPSKMNLKILSLAFEAGFNSKASFNTIFKSMVGVTPSEYRLNTSR